MYTETNAPFPRCTCRVQCVTNGGREDRSRGHNGISGASFHPFSTIPRAACTMRISLHLGPFPRLPGRGRINIRLSVETGLELVSVPAEIAYRFDSSCESKEEGRGDLVVWKFGNFSRILGNVGEEKFQLFWGILYFDTKGCLIKEEIVCVIPDISRCY